MPNKKSTFSPNTLDGIMVQWLRQLPYLPVALLIATIFVGVFSTNAAQQFLQNITNTQSTSLDTKLVLEKKPVAAPEYAPALSFCKQHLPDVKCDASTGKMVISIDNAQFYEDWIFALNNMQSYTKDLIWETHKLCIGECSGPAAAAILQASNQIIVKK